MPRAWTAISSQARITREYVSRLEAGRYDPTVGGVLQRLAKALKVKVAELLE